MLDLKKLSIVDVNNEAGEDKRSLKREFCIWGSRKPYGKQNK